MKNVFNIKTIIILQLLLFVGLLSAEKIYLKDGNVIIGEKVSQDDQKIVVKTSFGTIIINRSDIGQEPIKQPESQQTTNVIYNKPMMKGSDFKFSITAGYGSLHSGIGAVIGVGTNAYQFYGNLGAGLFGGGLKFYFGQQYSWFAALGYGRPAYMRYGLFLPWNRKSIYGPTLVFGHEFRFGEKRNLLVEVDGGATYTSTSYHDLSFYKIKPAADLAIGVKL